MLSDLVGATILMTYYLVICVSLPSLLKHWLKMPAELARKMQHIAYSFSIFILLNLFSTWYMAVGAAFLLVLLGYPALMLIERSTFYKKYFTDRNARGGELRKQLIYVQLSFAILIILYWGVLGTKWHYIVAVAVMAWGFGDAAAALVGKTFGRHRVIHKYIEKAKTYEGTGAMILVAGLALFFTLLCYAGKPWYVSLVVAGIVAPVCGVVELFSRRGTDTLTVPISAAALLMPLIHILTYFGW